MKVIHLRCEGMKNPNSITKRKLIFFVENRIGKKCGISGKISDCRHGRGRNISLGQRDSFRQRDVRYCV